jgi:hypothetical protein
MNPTTDNDHATVYRTSVGLLTIPKARTPKGLHAISSRINGVLDQVVKLHDSVAATAPDQRGGLRSPLNSARSSVSNLTADIQALRKQGAPIDAIQCAEVAQREMLGNLQKLQASLKLWPE